VCLEVTLPSASPQLPPLQDPTPIYAACPQLTSLILSNNYKLHPESLLPLFAGGSSSGSRVGALPAAAAAGAVAAGSDLLPLLQELDISYCSMPGAVLAAILTQSHRLHSLSTNGCRGGVTDQLWPLLHRRTADCGSEGDARVTLTVAAASKVQPGTPRGSQPQLGQMPEWRGLAPEPAGPACSTGSGGQPSAMSFDPATAAAGSAADTAGSMGGACSSQRGGGQQQQQQQQQQQPGDGDGLHRLRSLSMVGSKEMRSFCLGLVPAAAAQQHGLQLVGWVVCLPACLSAAVAACMDDMFAANAHLCGWLPIALTGATPAACCSCSHLALPADLCCLQGHLCSSRHSSGRGACRPAVCAGGHRACRPA
jgi:hypothetical protein